jgi:hypothetical protein
MRVRDMMTYGVVGAPETATIAEAVETICARGSARLLVFCAAASSGPNPSARPSLKPAAWLAHSTT